MEQGSNCSRQGTKNSQTTGARSELMPNMTLTFKITRSRFVRYFGYTLVSRPYFAIMSIPLLSLSQL